VSAHRVSLTRCRACSINGTMERLLRNRLRIFGFVMCILLACITIPATAAQTRLSSLKRGGEVFIVQDTTVTSNCVWYPLENPSDTKPCPPGTVIEWRKVSLKEAQAQGVFDYVPLTGDTNIDDAAIMQVVDELRRRILPGYGLEPLESATTSTCTQRIQGYGSAYNISGGTYRVQYDMQYKVNSNCTVTDIQDRTRADTGYQRFCWRESRVYTPTPAQLIGSTPRNWRISEEWYPSQLKARLNHNSQVDGYYMHVSSADDTCPPISDTRGSSGLIKFYR
jgi:hypothetical protein